MIVALTNDWTVHCLLVVTGQAMGAIFVPRCKDGRSSGIKLGEWQLSKVLFLLALPGDEVFWWNEAWYPGYPYLSCIPLWQLRLLTVFASDSNWGWCATLTPGISGSTSPTGTPNPESSNSTGLREFTYSQSQSDHGGEDVLSTKLSQGSSDSIRSSENLPFKQNFETASPSFQSSILARAVRTQGAASNHKGTKQQQTSGILNISKSKIIQNPFFAPTAPISPSGSKPLSAAKLERVLEKKLRKQQQPLDHGDRFKNNAALRSAQSPRITIGVTQTCPACIGGKGMICASDSAPATGTILGSADNSTYNRATVSSLPYQLPSPINFKLLQSVCLLTSAFRWYTRCCFCYLWRAMGGRCAP